MEKMLIIGASGFLGTKLLNIFEGIYEVTGTYVNNFKPRLHYLDIRKENSVNDFLFKEKPDVLVHTAALSDPDDCELDKENAEAINHFGTKNLVDACKKTGTKMVYISTVYVFDGITGNYSEQNTCNPVNWYGQTKLNAEREVMTLDHFIILRFDILYGFNGITENNGFFSKVIKGEGIEVNNDQLRQPLLVDDIGYALQVLIDNNHSGIFHLAGPDYMTKYQLGIALEKMVRSKSELIPIPEKQQVARRPKDVSINTEKALGAGIRFHSLMEGLISIRKSF